MTILAGKTIVVSGVGPGLGREIAQIVIRDGGNAVIGARNSERLKQVAATLDPSGAHVEAVPFDLDDAASCEALVARATARFGGIDGLVHVAAVDAVMGGLEETSEDDWDRTLRTNVMGTMRLTRAALPALRARGGGAVVIIGSQQFAKPAAAVPQLAYGASKGALFSAALTLAQTLGKDRIRVNTVVPTYMWGPPVQGFVQRAAEEHGVAEDVITAPIKASMPLGEIPLDEDVAEAVAFLCSDRSRMITGQTLFVNAGEFYW